MDEVLRVVKSMRSNRIPNYIAPGLISHLIGQVNCKVRLFEQTRHQEFYISPHNHRFDFACYVLSGRVRNHVYRVTSRFSGGEVDARLYQISTYIAAAKFGTKGYEVVPGQSNFFSRITNEYNQGDWYHMQKHEYHSIEFEKGSHVLFFEGAQQEQTSNFLEPVINGKVIPTFKVEDWMYHE